jgi:hypothetical protein
MKSKKAQYIKKLSKTKKMAANRQHEKANGEA